MAKPNDGEYPRKTGNVKTEKPGKKEGASMLN